MQGSGGGLSKSLKSRGGGGPKRAEKVLHNTLIISKSNIIYIDFFVCQSCYCTYNDKSK